jgi:hypothetical protein
LTTWTIEDRAALAAKIAAAVERVKYEGREVGYQPLADMRNLLAEMDSQISAASGGVTRSYATYTRD